VVVWAGELRSADRNLSRQSREVGTCRAEARRYDGTLKRKTRKASPHFEPSRLLTGEAKEDVMALIERGEPSPEQIRANRANAQKSTGPRTARGKREVARNSSKRGLLTDLFTESMRDLGEDPAAFGVLHRGFADSLGPANLLEEALVADLAKVWWKRSRAERAQSAYQVPEIEKLERQHRQKLLGMDPEDHAGEEIIAGTTRISKSCATNYHQVIGPLMYLLETVDKGDWLEEPEDLLDKIYGQFPTPRGVLIKQAFAAWLRAGEKLDDARLRGVASAFRPTQANVHLKVDATGEAMPDVEPAFRPASDDLDFQELLGGEPAIAAPETLEDDLETPEAGASSRQAGTSPAAEREGELRAALKSLLLQEIGDVTREYELYQTARAPLTPAARLARMAPCGEWQGGRGNAWPLMLRQEASLARQFDKSLRLLLILRGATPGNGQIKERRKSKVKRQRAKGKNGKNSVASAFRPTRLDRRRLPVAPASRPTESGIRDHKNRPRETRKSPKSEKQSRYVYENTGPAHENRNPALKRRKSARRFRGVQ